jgi:hypothetical protein
MAGKPAIPGVYADQSRDLEQEVGASDTQYLVRAPHDMSEPPLNHRA